MSSIPPVRRIQMQDVMLDDGTIDTERLLYSVNQFLESAYEIFDGGTDFVQNIASQIQVLEFVTAATYTASKTFAEQTFLINMKRAPHGVLVLQIYDKNDINTPITEAVSLSWRVIKESISIDFVTGLKDSTTYILRIMVI